MNATTLPCPAPWDHETVFEKFLAKRATDWYDPLSVAAARPYRSIWLSWCKFLNRTSGESEAKSWVNAHPSDLANFLYNGGMTPAGKRRSTLSDISQRRYWTVIHSVYAFAKNNGQVNVNPASGLAHDDVPTLIQSEGQIYNPNDWRAIRKAIPEGTSTVEIRNRALLLVLMDAALTTSEITKLRTQNCTATNLGFTITISGSRKNQPRKLVLGSEASAALACWLSTRPKRGVAGPNRDALFTTQKRGPIRPTGVYHVVDQTVRMALTEGAVIPSHTGAQRLRNTRIVQWVNEGVDIDEVVRRAGLKDRKSLRGLALHIEAAQRSLLSLDRSKDASAKTEAVSA